MDRPILNLSFAPLQNVSICFMLLSKYAFMHVLSVYQPLVLVAKLPYGSLNYEHDSPIRGQTRDQKSYTDTRLCHAELLYRKSLKTSASRKFAPHLQVFRTQRKCAKYSRRPIYDTTRKKLILTQNMPVTTLIRTNAHSCLSDGSTNK